MKRRGFLGRLLALPFVPKLARALPAETVAPRLATTAFPSVVRFTEPVCLDGWGFTNPLHLLPGDTLSIRVKQSIGFETDDEPGEPLETPPPELAETDYEELEDW